MSLNFFSDALRQAMADRHFNQAQLAEFLNVDPAYVSRWLKGSSPRLDQMRTVLSALGWEIDRARPGYDPFADAIERLKNRPSDAKERGAKGFDDLDEVRRLLQGAAENHKRACQPPVVHSGKLIAAAGEVKFDSSEAPESFECLSEVFPAPGYADSELIMITVSGSELYPVYPEGTRLVLRRVLKVNSVPDGSEVIFESARKNNSFYLRRLVRIAEKKGRIERIIGVPLVPSQDYLFFRPRELRVPFVVVGSLLIGQV